MSNLKKAVDKKGLEKSIRDATELAPDDAFVDATGVAGDRIVEPLPKYIQTPSEKVISNDNGASIVLGRDRPEDRLSGYGGQGDTQCASIDIVVGRMGSGVKSVDGDNEPLWVDPDFEEDAARIYISQKTDVDENFSLPGTSDKTKSAVAIKADNVRLISREKVKVVAGVDEKNSQGALSRANYGIELISNNNVEDLQSLVKGENLSDLLGALIDHIDSLNGVIEALIRQQVKINSALISHIHPSAAGPTSPSIELASIAIPSALKQAGEGYTSLLNHKLNSSILKLNYLLPLSKKYINSKNNKTN